MGAGGSLPHNFKSDEPPPLPPPFYTGNLQSGASRISGSSCESEQDRRASGTSTITLGNPGFQNGRSSRSVKNEEWWHRRPSAPSLSSLRPQQETLLTYAAQMTGWQTGCETGVPSMHREAMELSRTVSHLAAANQQLASAHTTLLAQLEALYLELNRERELRLEREREDRARERISASDEEKLPDRLPNLDAYQYDRKSRNLEEEVSKLFTKEIGVQSENCSEELVLASRSSWLETNASRRFFNREHFEKPNSGRSENEDFEESGNNLNEEYQKALERIESLENELAISHIDVNSTLNINENKGLKGKNDESLVKDFEYIDGRCEVGDFNSGREFRELLEEIDRLKNDRLEYRARNKKIIDDLENRATMMENLKRDYEISRSQCENVESSLNELKSKFDALLLNYESIKLEKARLTRELETFNFERDTANGKIADLERELAISIDEKNRLSNIENQESSRLKKMLSSEMTSKNEQGKALEEALKEIQRLNEVIESGKCDEMREIESTENAIEPNAEEEMLDTESSVVRSSNMEEFRKELSLKREARQRAIAAVSSEMDRLRRELDAEKEAHSETSKVLDLLKSGQASNIVAKSEIIPDSVPVVASADDSVDCSNIMKPDPELNSNQADAQTLTDILKVSDELRSSIRLQIEKIDDLRYHLECEPEGHKIRISHLQEIARKNREASMARDRQINKLKNLLSQILAHLGDPRFRVEITEDVRSEHDRQIEDIRRLKSLYDDRLRVLVDLKETASKELHEVKEKLRYTKKENSALEEDLQKAEEKIDNQDTEISSLESQLGLTKADCRDLQNQMSVINGLFTQMLLSASSADMDLDRLTRLLQENHDLISGIAREEGTEAAALPKLLLDIVEQVDGRGAGKSGDKESDKKEDDPQEENIAHNLPKVWRVLLELISCHANGSPPVTPASLSTDPNSCYKSVDTPSGPRLVISVSKTYIRLKELILEKKHLEKEMNRMKTLNTHLESKLGEQEKRLSTVTSELSKTWNIVGRMQAQHQQLHTHEKILRYELQQKRKMLQELKQELEYCREKWESARQKNTNTEIEWRSLRREFAARKSLVGQDSFNNSAESGFSDERGDDSDEEDETVGERVRLGPRRRTRKENPRAPTPDTESEQPTDTELSETKTPETNVSTEDVSLASTNANSTEKLTNESDLPNNLTPLIASEDDEATKSMNTLDQALTNVIQNLIVIDDSEVDENSILSSDKDTVLSFDQLEEKCEDVSEEKDDYPTNSLETSNTAQTDNSTVTATKDGEANEEEDPLAVSAVSVFSIGPFPTSLPSTKSVQFSDPLVVGPSTQTLLPVFGSALPEAENLDKDAKLKDCEEVAPEKCLTKETQEVNAEIPTVLSSTSEDSNKSSRRVKAETISSEETTASTSEDSAQCKPVRSHEEVLAARAARLQRLEEQADWLMKKMNATSRRGSALSTRLEELHEVYGEAPVPPPMPDVLPNVRIPSEMSCQKNEETGEKSQNEKPPPDSP